MFEIPKKYPGVYRATISTVQHWGEVWYLPLPCYVEVRLARQVGQVRQVRRVWLVRPARKVVLETRDNTVPTPTDHQAATVRSSPLM